MAHEVVLTSPEKSKYLIGLSPVRVQFWAFYDFLGSAKLNWNEVKGYDKKKVKSLNQFSIFYYPVEIETWILYFQLHTGMLLVNTQLGQYLLPALYFFFINLRTTDIFIMFPEQQEVKDPLPKLFRTFKNIHASVDCIEFKCEMP